MCYGIALGGAALTTGNRYKRESCIACLNFAYRFGQNQTSQPPRKSKTDEAKGDFERAMARYASGQQHRFSPDFCVRFGHDPGVVVRPDQADCFTPVVYL